MAAPTYTWQTPEHLYGETLFKNSEEDNSPPEKRGGPPPAIGKIEKKQLLIFAVYVPVGTQSEVKSRARLNEIKSSLIDKFDRIQAQTDYIIETFVFATKGEGDPKMECIFNGDKGNFYPKDFTQEYTQNQGFTIDDDVEETKNMEKLLLESKMSDHQKVESFSEMMKKTLWDSPIK